MNETITTAKVGEADVERLVDIVQLAYRGGLAKVGWKNEHDLVTGPRIDQNKMRALLANNEAAVIKVMTGGDGQLAGCVLAEKHGDSVHIGMLAVHPDFQNMKLGKVLVEAAEQYAANTLVLKLARCLCYRSVLNCSNGTGDLAIKKLVLLCLFLRKKRAQDRCKRILYF
ncbi:MAG: GNAT family N-acetyltransferase [Candidatus Obscuribacter sp.]|nr:GNAT family N-acetyltransferase [Candidatus Obscuribacter sp.]